MRPIDPLTPVYKALADQKRRQIVTLLQEKPRTTSELCAFFDVSRFAVMKHLNVLEEANLIEVQREGRQRWNILNDRVLPPVVDKQQPTEVGRPAASPTVALTCYSDFPHSPAQVFQALTADVDSWWPGRTRAVSRLVLEPFVNGRFYEVYDEAGHGSLYGIIIHIEPERELRISGPMGIADRALVSLVRLCLAPLDDGQGTRLTIEHRLSGETDEALSKHFQNTWPALLTDHLRPFLAASAPTTAAA